MPPMPLLPALILTVVCSVSGIALFAVGRMMRTDKLPPNMLVGIRTARSRESTEAWYKAQREGASATIGGGAAFILSAAITMEHILYPSTVTVIYPIVACIFSALLTVIWTFISSRA